MTKYGMKHSTVRYWQDSAKTLLAMRGRMPFVSLAARLNREIETMDNREITKLVIQFAYLGIDIREFGQVREKTTMYNTIGVSFYVTRTNLATLVAIRIPASVRESSQAELMHVTYKCNGPDDVCRLMAELSAHSLTLTD